MKDGDKTVAKELGMKLIDRALSIAKYLAIAVGITTAAPAAAQQVYNSIATAYVTTTISQFVVFDSTMQQGGTFDFSVLAHNGGGRAGQSDTANVKIEFYNSSNQIVATANTSYSNNLPNPNALGGNPQIDPAVPWTTLAISKTLTQAQAATVTYAKVSMYGIDGSYWAGDYGPWYRAPTLTLNSTGNNMLYNPEFGPYNGTTAQGWTSSPGFGACQGAWGGSNACIVNSSGQPGQSTVGLVANQNGGGPSATGGTTGGTPGGYNSTMSTSNPSGAPAATTSTNATGTTITTSLGQTTDSTITNNGTINTTGTDAGISATDAATTTITNAGAITTDNGSGINAQQGTSTTGNITITNSGSIDANTSGGTGNGGSYTAHGIIAAFNGTGSTGTATINNTATGTIAVTNGDGVVMMGYGNTVLNNAGSITSTPTGTNSMPAVLMGNQATLNNDGSITGDVGVDFVGTTAGSTINNNATGTITGNSGMAIISVGTNTGMIINNAGTITGDVMLSTNGVLNQLGTGSIAGAVRTKDSSAVVNIGTNATTATTTLAGNLGDAANTTVATGAYGNFPMAFTAQNLSALNINTGSTLTDNTGYSVYATNITNNGTVVVGAGANMNLNGAVTSNGNITTWFNGPQYGQFTVTGPLALGANATYTPMIVGNSSTNVTLNSPYASVISATGGITGTFVGMSGQVAGVNWTMAPNATNANAFDVTWTPSVYVTGTAPGNPVVVSTSTDGTTTTTTTTTNGTPTTVANITTGTPVSSTSVSLAGARAGRDINVTKTDVTSVATPFTTLYTTTTPVTTTVTVTTPVTTVTDTTPTTVTTYSDGTTTTTPGSTTTTTTNTNRVVNTPTTVNQVTTTTVSGSQIRIDPPVFFYGSANVAGMEDNFKLSRTNPFLVDPLMPRNDNWVESRIAQYTVQGSSQMSGGVSFGKQKTVGENTFGFAMDLSQADSSSYLNSSNKSQAYSGTAYILSKQPEAWYKFAVGAGFNDVSNTVTMSFPGLKLANVQKGMQTNLYADAAVYAPTTMWGFRPFAGATLVNSQMNNYSEMGWFMLSSGRPQQATQVNPYVGTRYEIDKDIGMEVRATQTTDFGTVFGARLTAQKEVAKNVGIKASIGGDVGNNYSGVTGMIGLNVKF
jgi:hypothetical protein